MLSSLKLYKGILEFVQLSERLPQYHFLLVVNDTQKNIENFVQCIISYAMKIWSYGIGN